MSKDNPNLRLLGSPVNLSYRSKKKDDKKNNRNRPRSALQNSYFTPDYQERFRRPFSADTKERGSVPRPFFKAYSAELLNQFSYPITTIKVVAPTAELLGNTKFNNPSVKKNKEICSNASDYGSEDTFISLGTKIKARAQLGGGFRAKPQRPNKNTLKYRNIAKKGKRPMDDTGEEKNNEYEMEIKITERPQSVSPTKNILSARCLSPSFKKAYESYFLPFDTEKKLIDEEALAGRVSFGSSNIQAEVEQAIDTYSRRLTSTKQQLSLVEEESTQDVDATSQHMSSLSPENSLEGPKKDNNNDGDLTGRNTYVVDRKDYSNTQNFMNESRTYTSFYDDFCATSNNNRTRRLSSTAIHTDTSSKDSGYPDSGANDDKSFAHNFSLPNTISKKSKSHPKIVTQPKSLDATSNLSSNQIYHNTFPGDRKSQWVEPLNHSRLLYKDFFLQKEGHIALPPQNSTDNVQTIPNEVSAETKTEKVNDNVDYPPYLLNSTTKAYTCKVIEDYKKELEAINNLHELTLKDIRTDAISPTPYNIDKMFDEHSGPFEDKRDSSDSQASSVKSKSDKNKNTLTPDRDISKVSTKELIQNYLKVKQGEFSKEFVPGSTKKFDKTVKSVNGKVDSCRQDWNNKNFKSNTAAPKHVNIRNQTQKNLFTMRPPVSARLESVQSDRDVDSWMSLSAPSPRILELDDNGLMEFEKPEPAKAELTKAEPAKTEPAKAEPPKTKPAKFDTALVKPGTPRARKETGELHNEKSGLSPFSASTAYENDSKPKELNTNSTVLDIYSMLKEIEDFGENPVTSVTNLVMPESPEAKKEKENNFPKDHFMEIFEFLEKVEQSANDALSVVTTNIPQTVPKLEQLLKLPQTELAQRLVTASLQLEERSCCIALLQESLANHKEQMINKVSNLEKQSQRNINKIKLECEETIKRHQNFIDQLINDKKTLNHRIEQLVDERRTLEERWKRSAQTLEERYKLELRNQHDKMAAAQQVARQRWVRQKAEKIKELTVKGLEGELREMAERQHKEISDMKMCHAEYIGKLQARHMAEMEELRRTLEEEKECALAKERQVASSRLEKQILELEVTYQEQRTRLVAEMRAENDRRAAELVERERSQKTEFDVWREEQEKILQQRIAEMEQELAKEKSKVDELMEQKQKDLEQKFEQYKKDFEAEQQMLMKKKVTEITAQHKLERDKEIEKAIESMEAEAQAGRKELQEALKRNKEQYEAELKELAETERATLRRYQEAQARIRQTEDRCAEMEVMLSQLEIRNKILTEKNIHLEKQAEEIRKQCDEAWIHKIEDLKREMEELKKTHEEQMHQLYAKVKVAVARKDSAIQALTREAAKYQEKVVLLEQKLQQQRKDFLKHK